MGMFCVKELWPLSSPDLNAALSMLERVTFKRARHTVDLLLEAVMEEAAANMERKQLVNTCNRFHLASRSLFQL